MNRLCACENRSAVGVQSLNQWPASCDAPAIIMHAGLVFVALAIGDVQSDRCPVDMASVRGPEDLLRVSHALRRDRMEEAVACYNRITVHYPHFAAGWFELGQALLDSGRASEAVPAMKKGLALDPSANDKRLEYGRALQQLKRLDEARAVYKSMVSQMPSDATARFHLGSVEDARGDRVAALRAYHAALELGSPDEAHIHNNIGAVHSAMGNWEPAVAAFEQAVEVDPELVDGWYNLGNSCLALQRHGDAESHLKRALNLAPAHPKARLKIEQVRADATRHAQMARFGAEHLEVTGDARTKRESDGPMLV